MSEEESESVDEEIYEQSFDPEEWIEWFDQFKDEKGEWLLDNSILEGVSDQFMKDRKESVSDSSEEIEEETEEEENEEEETDSEVSQEENLFERKLQEFTEFAKDYLSSKITTLADCNRPYRASNPKIRFYKEFREYLENQGFMENMIDVLVKMFAMHPELPEKPLSFIRDNYGISQKEEDRLIAEWTAVSEEMLMLEDEGKALEKRIKWRLKQPREQGSTESVKKSESRIQCFPDAKKQPQSSDDKFVREESSGKESSFHWVCSDPSSIPSSKSSTRAIGSEITLLPLEEEQQTEHSVTPKYEYDDFKETDASSSSLDVGSIELD